MKILNIGNMTFVIMADNTKAKEPIAAMITFLRVIPLLCIICFIAKIIERIK